MPIACYPPFPLFLLTALLLFLPAPCHAAEPEATAILEQFAKDWPDGRTAYRTEGDSSWIVYAKTLSQLVAMGDQALPALIEGSKNPSPQVRALCARVLGFSGEKSVASTLIELLGDKSSFVAVLAADALGQLQDPAGLEALRAARLKHTNGDVLLHISKALDRKTPLEEGVREQVVQINSKTINSAKVGQLAPDFTLSDSTGKAWQLEDFRGKKSVVLVFIYGDG